jgi:hypothetical protein
MMQVIPMTGHILLGGFLADLAFWAAVIFGVLMVMLHFGRAEVAHHEILKSHQH